VKKRELVQVLLICSVLFSVNLVFVLSQPITSPVVVVFGSSAEEDKAVEILKNELTDVIVTKYHSVEFELVKQRCYGPMVVVAHGSGAGVRYGDVRLTAERLLPDVLSSPTPRLYLLACESGAIASEDISRRTFGFDYPIDAELAALTVAIYIQLSYGLVDSALNSFDRFSRVLDSKISGDSPIQPLMPIEGGGGAPRPPPPPPSPVFSYQEQFNIASLFLSGCVWAVVGVAVGVVLGKLASVASSKVGQVGLSSTRFKPVIDFFKAHAASIARAGSNGGAVALRTLSLFFGSLGQLATTWIGLVIETLFDLIAALDAFEWALFIMILGMELLVVIISAGMEAIVRLEAGLVICVFNCAVIAYVDISDSNSVPCTSLVDAIGQLCD
jgi:hypothetical protein